MIELILKDYLDEKLSVPYYTEKPLKPPESYVLADKTGGSKSNHLPVAIIAFQSYAPNKYEAALLNEELKQAIELMAVEMHEIRGVTLDNDYNFTDPNKKEHRYQAVFEIRYY